MPLIKLALDKNNAEKLSAILASEDVIIKAIIEEKYTVKDAGELNDFLICARKNKDPEIRSATVLQFLKNIINFCRLKNYIDIEKALTSSYSLYKTMPETGLCFFDTINPPNGHNPDCYLLSYKVSVTNRSPAIINCVATIFGFNDAEARQFNTELRRQHAEKTIDYKFDKIKTGTKVELPGVECDYILDQENLTPDQLYYILKAIQQRDFKSMVMSIYNSVLRHRETPSVGSSGVFSNRFEDEKIEQSYERNFSFVQS